MQWLVSLAALQSTGKCSIKRQEWNLVQPDFATGAEPGLLEYDISSYVFTKFKHCTILEKQIINLWIQQSLRHVYIEALYKVQVALF